MCSFSNAVRPAKVLAWGPSRIFRGPRPPLSPLLLPPKPLPPPSPPLRDSFIVLFWFLVSTQALHFTTGSRSCFKIGIFYTRFAADFFHFSGTGCHQRKINLLIRRIACLTKVKSLHNACFDQISNVLLTYQVVFLNLLSTKFLVKDANP